MPDKANRVTAVYTEFLSKRVESMGKPTLSLITGLMFFIGQGAAHAASDARCLTRDERESLNTYAGRVHQSCDAAWNNLQPRRPASGAEYNAYMTRCEKPCAALVSAGVPTTALVLGALLVAGGAGAAAAGGSKGSPASP